MIVCAMNFGAARNGKKLSLGLFRPNLPQLGFLFACICSFRQISTMKIVIFDQNKQVLLILKIKKSEISKLHVYYPSKWKLDKYTTHSKIKVYIFYVQ